MIIKIGILGAGRVAEHYVYILKRYKIKNYKIVGVADTSEKNALHISKKLKCEHYKSFEKMMQSQNLDLIFILTPSGLHYNHVKKALNKNINVLVEKPIAMRPSQIKELISISKKRKLTLCSAFQNRLNPSIIFAKKILKEKKLGKIITSSVRLRWCRYQDYYEDGWHGKWLMDGGVLNQQAIHHLDAINFLLGPIEKVSSSSTNRVNILEAEDSIVSIFKFNNGSLGTFEATTAARPKDIEASLSITGEKGYIDIGGVALNQLKEIKYKSQKIKSKDLCNKYSQKVPSGYGLSHRLVIEGIIRKLNRQNTKNIILAKDCLATTELVHAIYNSNENNKWTSLNGRHLSVRLGMK